MPDHRRVERHREAGYTETQAYVRAFNDANNLRHTAFEQTPATVERIAA